MAYIPTIWENDITDVDEDNMNHIEEGVKNSYNVSLLAVSDTAPSECNEGDKYYNTTTNKIYTATGADIWSEDGEEPLQDILYVVFGEQNTYAYDGTQMLSVGGGGSTPDFGNIVVDSIRSKNMFNTDSYVGGALNINTGQIEDLTGATITSINSDTGTISFTSARSWRGIFGEFIEVEQNKEYTLSLTSNNDTLWYIVFFYDNSKNFVSSLQIKNTIAPDTDYNFTIPSGVKYARFLLESSNNTTTPANITLSNIQLELGSTSTSFTPYQKLDGKEVYSTSEIIIGTWIDGRPIYRKVYTGTTATITSGGYSTFTDSNLMTMDDLIRFHYSIKDGTNRIVIPNVGDRIASTYIQTSYGGVGMIVQNSSYYSNFSNKPFTIILEYTKTTD